MHSSQMHKNCSPGEAINNTKVSKNWNQSLFPDYGIKPQISQGRKFGEFSNVYTFFIEVDKLLLTNGSKREKTQEIRKYIEMKEKREPNLWDRIKLMGVVKMTPDQNLSL